MNVQNSIRNSPEWNNPNVQTLVNEYTKFRAILFKKKSEELIHEWAL